VKGFEEKVMEALEKEGGLGVKSAAGEVTMKEETDRLRDTTEHKEQLPTSATLSEQDIEAAIEAVTDAEIAHTAVEELAQTEPVPVQETATSQSTFAEPATGYAYYEEAFRELFSEKKVLTITQKELTTVALEGAVGGAAFMGLLLVLLRPK
jgi:sensitive to high expression protein 9